MARRVLHTFSFLTLLATALVVQSTPNIAPQVIYRKLEDALFSNSSLLYKMQEVLIPSRILPRVFVDFHIHVTVGSMQPLDCDNSSLFDGRSIFPYTKDFKWSSSALVDLILIDQLFILDNVISYSVFHVIELHEHLYVPLHIDTFPCEPTEDHILAAFMQLLPWSYVRAPGKRNENDKGYVSIIYSQYVEGSYYKQYDTSARHFYRLSLMFTFIFLSTLTPIALSKMVFLYYPRIRTKFTTGDYVECLYCATAFVTFISNTLYTVLSIWNLLYHGRPTITSCLIYHDSCSVPSDPNVYKDEILTVLAVYIIIPSEVFAEWLVSVLVVKNNFYDKRSLRDGQRPSWKQFLQQGFYVFGLWNILVAIQLITMIATPIFVLLFVNPQVTVLYSLLLLTIPVSVTLIVAYLLYHCQQQRRRRAFCNVKSCGQKFVQLIVMIAIPGLIIALIALYEVMLLVQVQIGTGVKGLLFSLLPSFPLSAIGWYLKRRSQKKAEKSNDSKTLQPMVEDQPSGNIPLPV